MNGRSGTSTRSTRKVTTDVVSRYYKGTPVEAGPTESTRRLAIKNRIHWRLVVSAEIAETMKPYEIYLDFASRVWVQNVLGKKWRLPVGEYSIEAHIREGMVIHPLTKKRLE